MSQKNYLSSNPARYNDFKIRLIAVAVGSYIVTEYGGDESMLSRLLSKSFYIEFGSTFIITFLLVQYIYKTTYYLDSRYTWHEKLSQRIPLQIFFGIIIPTIGAFLLAAIYFAFYHVNILSTNYHLYALPFIAALITLFNAYYLIRYLLLQVKEKGFVPHEVSLMDRQQERGTGQQKVYSSPALSEKTLVHGNDVMQDDDIFPTPTERELYIVSTPLKNIPLKMEDICSFYRSNGINYVRTYDQTINEAYVISHSLKEIEDMVSPVQFFRINRQMIVNINSCRSFRNGKGKGLELFVEPVYVDAENGMKEMQYVLVSEDRAQGFKSWINR